METTSVNGKQVVPASPPLVSRTAILILSGVLIGTALGRGRYSGIDICCFFAGVVGVLSFLALDYVANRRCCRMVSDALATSRRVLDSRIERHVRRPPSWAGAAARDRRRRDEASYLTVIVA